MKKPRTTLSGLFIRGLYAFLLSYAGIAAAVDSISLSPGSDITFTDPSDSRLLFIQVNPPEAGVNLVVDVDSAVVVVSHQELTTDSNGAAKLTITPGIEQNTVFLKVWAGDVKSNAIVVKTIIDEEPKVFIKPETLDIDLNDNPNSQAIVSVLPPKSTTVTLYNDSPDVVDIPTYLTTDRDGFKQFTIIANKVGEARVTASLADGTESNTLIIKASHCNQISIDATNPELGVNESKTFTVADNCTGLKWSVRDGKLEPMTGNQVTYTAPDYPGAFPILVTNDEVDTIINVNVTGPLRISPEDVSFKIGEPVEVQALGGKPPYKFRIKEGSGRVQLIGHKDFALITDLDVGGQSIVEVSDSLENTAQATLNVVQKIQLSRPYVEITQETVPETIDINEGVPDFDVRVEKGDFKLVGREIQITAIPPNNGTYKLVVRDATGEGTEAVIDVKIPGRLQIDPKMEIVELGKTVTFRAVGGQAPYTFASSQGSLSCSECEETNLEVTADNTNSDITVEVTDEDSGKATALVKVVQSIRLVPSDSPIKIFVGESKRFEITGGSGIYYYRTNFGQSKDTIQETSDGGKSGIIFTAPMYSEKVTLTVTDTRNSEPAEVVFDVNVQTELEITPSEKYLGLGSSENEDFKIIGRYEGERVKVSAEKGTINQAGDDILYTPPALSTTDVLHVESLNDPGRTAKADITIASPLSITPAVMYVDAAASKKFQVHGGVGSYTFEAKYGSFEPPFDNASDTGVEITYRSPGLAKNDEEITVTDSKGSKQSARVRLNNHLRITPLMATLAPEESVEFMGFQGLTPYCAEKTGGKADKIHTEVGKERYRYTAPATPGKYTITLIDERGNKATAEIFVNADLKMSPKMAVLRPGETTTIKVSGGSAPYQFTTRIGSLSERDTQTGQVRYTAPLDFEGEEITAYVRAFDASGEVSTEIRVVKTPKSLISANSTTFMAGDNLKINLTSLGKEKAADVYVAVAFPDGQLLFFDENSQPIPEQLPFLRNYVVSDETTYQNVFSMESLPDLDQQGQLTLYSLLVKPGTAAQDLLNPANWLCENEKECGLSSFELKVK
ncbi:MAG: hypothetical protein DRR19_19790 [Candidatus Parabeggiatoa sp. nov. 1]|nr:MAG: hypothetical protein DRR19_19790 [Gammaproteobacteria bacterium]